MANNKIVFAGLEEFKQQLRNLPAHLVKEASGIVTEHALNAGVKVEAVYHEHDQTGNLSKGVKVDAAVNVGGFGVLAMVRSTSRHAWLFDNGSQARHYVTESGRTHKTGKMWGRSAPTHVFVRTMIRERRAMTEDLIGMVQNEGFTVSGNG